MPVERLKLVGNPLTRRADTSVDQYFKNCYSEAVDQENFFVVKRPGLKASIAHTSGVGRGVYSWRGNLYSVVGNTVYKGTGSLGTLNTSTGPVYFTSTGGGTPLLVLQDKTDAWTINTSDTLTEVTDADYPTNIVDGIAFIDQYVLVMDQNGAIWNSDVNDPTSWASTDFITAEGSPDVGVCIIRHHNYIVGLGEYSIEFFYDAANATGSPLSKVDASIIHIGCAAGQTVQHIDNTVFFIGQDRSGGKRVYSIKGTSVEPVSPKPVERLLDAEGSTLDTAYAFSVRISGHLFYVLTLPTTDKTLVYDVIDQVWHEWTSYTGATESHFTGKYCATVDGTIYIQDEDNGEVYEFDTATYQDGGDTIKVRGVTDLYDANTTQTKFHPRLEVAGDENTTSGNLSISYTDDNYKTYSTARTINLNDRAYLTRLGRFQRRAFKYEFEANAPMRLEYFDLTVDLGGYGE